MVNNGDIEKRRASGSFFTNSGIAEIAYQHIMKLIQPDFIFEPCVGMGALIRPFLQENQIQLAINDLNKAHIASLIQEFDNKNIWHLSEDILSHKIDEIFLKWLQRGKFKKILMYTNPPFGTSSTNAMVITGQEKQQIEGENRNSRRISINYSGLDKKYGRGDLCIPIIGKIIELLKTAETGYLAFFSPMGLFCGRKR